MIFIDFAYVVTILGQSGSDPLELLQPIWWLSGFRERLRGVRRSLYDKNNLLRHFCDVFAASGCMQRHTERLETPDVEVLPRSGILDPYAV